ncbi:hypothetical protein GGI42DRAFT_262201 [Trichoderma sp. SZMC 28013]
MAVHCHTPKKVMRIAEIAKCLPLLWPSLALIGLCWKRGQPQSQIGHRGGVRRTGYQVSATLAFRTVAHGLMQVDVMGHFSLCREGLGETGKRSSAHAICDTISHNSRASRTANSTGYRLASAAYQRRASRPRNRKLARQYGIESPHDTTFSDTVALRRRVF